MSESQNLSITDTSISEHMKSVSTKKN